MLIYKKIIKFLSIKVFYENGSIFEQMRINKGAIIPLYACRMIERLRNNVEIYYNLKILCRL